MKKGLLIITLLGTLLSCNTPEVEVMEIESELANVFLWSAADKAFILDEFTRTTEAVIQETESLTEEQAAFLTNDKRWSITEIIEHLEVQNELHFREIRAISKTPQLRQYIAVVEGQDRYFQAYATDTVKGNSQWFLEPIGRFKTKTAALAAFIRVRTHFSDFVASTEIDFRKHFTFRRNLEDVRVNDIKPGDVRDLHQLLLTGIAHTDRHLAQIRQIKQHKDFPK